MLSVKPGSAMDGKGAAAPVGTAMLSVALSTIDTVFPFGLKTAVYFPFGASAISEGCTLTPDKGTKKVSESWSFEASTMLNTGEIVSVPLAPLALSGFEMKARNLMPLGLCVVVVEELLLPQEIMVILTVTSTKMLAKILFKPGTPKSMKDKDLDARNRIITEPLRRILRAEHCVCGQDAKAAVLLYSEENGYRLTDAAKTVCRSVRRRDGNPALR
jgi:hypothetical protein